MGEKCELKIDVVNVLSGAIYKWVKEEGVTRIGRIIGMG